MLTIDKLCWFSLLMYVDYISINSVSGFGWSWGILLDTIWQLCCHGTIVRSWAVFEQFCINNQTARFQYVIRTKQRKIVWCFDTVIWWTDRQQTSASPFLNFPRIPQHVLVFLQHDTFKVFKIMFSISPNVKTIILLNLKKIQCSCRA